MATDATMTHGPALEAWLERLDAEGFAVGLRERLVVQRLMLQLAVNRELPADLRAMLALAMPLLCTKPQQQRRYQDLLASFDPLPPAEAAAGAVALPPAVSQAQKRTRLWQAMLTALVALLLASLVYFIWGLVQSKLALENQPEQPALATGVIADAPAPGVPPPNALEQDDGLQVYVPQRLLIEASAYSGWRQLLQLLLVTVGTFAGVLLIGQLWGRRRRQLFLQGVRSDEAVREHLLHDVEPVRVGPSPMAARAVARGLRQRVEGDTLALDVAATLRASLRAGGALAPRWRALRRTPEYLVLVEQRHGADHHSAYVHSLLGALAEAGVALEVWHFDGSPAQGCWPAALEFGSDAAAGRRVAASELLTRHTGQRLLVFGPVQALLDPLHGHPQRWTKSLAMLPQRAWFTPMPLQAWGNAEAQADALGFLLLPQQPGALDTLAGWLASQRLELAVQPDWPMSYPPLLRDNIAAWAARDAAPDADTLGELLFQLRTALGPQRMRWLWACAVFPALSPPLTLALGRELLPDNPRALALGMSALAALPWFRYGRLPDWLREALLDDMAAKDHALQQRLRSFIELRLDSALLDGNTPVLARVAAPQRVAAWLRRGRGLARDLVMVRFLEEDAGSRLLQRLPPGLRRRLFKHGLPALGLRFGVLAWAVVAASVALAISWANPWPLVVPPLVAAVAAWRARSRYVLIALGTMTLLTTVLQFERALEPAVRWFENNHLKRSFSLHSSRINTDEKELFTAAQFSEDGRSLVLQMSSGRQYQWDLRPSDSTVQDDVSGRILPAGPPLTPRRSAMANQGKVRVDIDESGTVRIQGLGADGRWRDIREDSNELEAKLEFLALSPDGAHLALGNGMAVNTYVPRSQPISLATHLALIDCESARSVSPALRSAAEAAAAYDYHSRVAAYTPKAFDRLHGRSARADPGTIRVGNSEGKSASGAEVVQGWAMAQWPGLPWTVTSLDDARADPVVAVGACLEPPQAQAPPMNDEEVALKARLAQIVAQMFDPDAQVRIQATRALEADLANLSDAVPLAVERALVELMVPRQAVDNATASGVINAMVLLESASPATLRANRDKVAELLDRAAAIGKVSASRAKNVALRLTKADMLRPQVFIQYAGAAQRPLAQVLQQRLRELKFDVPGIEDVTGRAPLPKTPEVRVRGASDRFLASEIGAKSAPVLEQTLGNVFLPQRADNDRYELWLDSDVCVTRQAAACRSGQSNARVPVAATK